MTVYAEIVKEMGGTVWKSWRNLDFIVQKLQGAYNRSRVSYKWGFSFSVDKTKTMFFIRKITGS